MSAAFPLANAGLKVLLLDPDQANTTVTLPEGKYLDERFRSDGQWRWSNGYPGDASLTAIEASSPKFRVPTLLPIFKGYAEALGIDAKDFDVIGSLASGGLTNAWGAGISTYTSEELKNFPEAARDLSQEYAIVAQRIGVSGGSNDDVSSKLGLSSPVQPPHALHPMGQYLQEQYTRHRSKLTTQGFAMGRARLAVLTEPFENRLECNRSGMCLWGCKREAVYSARHDLELLKRRPNVIHLSGTMVESIRRLQNGWALDVLELRTRNRRSIHAPRVVLAAGTIATSKLALALLQHYDKPVRLHSNPTAAFALFFPSLLGSELAQTASLAHHTFTLQSQPDYDSSGFLFPTLGIPMSEFATRTPFGLRSSIGVLAWLLPAMTIGNIFFDSRLSNHKLKLKSDGTLEITGGFHESFQGQRINAGKKLSRAFRTMRSFVMPGSFNAGTPGSDVHYAGTFPMSDTTEPLKTSGIGELPGLHGIHLVDGAILPVLPGKPHTFTIMANATRIGQRIAKLAS